MEELITYCQNDDFEATEELIKRIEKDVYATLFYLDAQSENILDLTQDVLMKVIKNIKCLKNPEKFRCWLNQIITNTFYDHLRKSNRKVMTVPLENSFDLNLKTESLQIPDSKPKPLDATLNRELEGLIEESIHSLPRNFRVALVLREFQGLSYEEIAKITDSNVGTVKSRISRARNKLQEKLKPYIA